MVFTRKIGKLIRGNTTPFQIYAATLLAAFLGFIPSFNHAPGLVLFWGFLLLILNANLFLAGFVGLLSKLIYLVSLPVCFSLGRVLLEGPTQGFFETLHNGPVTAYFGLDYYAVVGGQLLALAVGLAFGVATSKGLKAYRLRMAQRQNDTTQSSVDRKTWVKACEWLFVGKKSDKSYDELLARRIGNPIRIVGAIAVLFLIGAIFVVVRFFSDGLITSLARQGLETANGATVDLEGAHMDLKQGRLELVNLALADPNNLETDIFTSRQILADISATDILRKRFSIDKLVVTSASSGTTREIPGELVGPVSKTPRTPEVGLPDFQDLDSVLENAEVWKERLTQLKRWLDRVSTVSKPEIMKAPKMWEQELANRIRLLGHANVKATMLTQDSPLLWIRDLEALGVKAAQLEGRLIDIEASNLSTHPRLVENSPSISMRSQDGDMTAQLALGMAAGKDENVLDFVYKNLPTTALANSLKADGKPLLEGGTIDFTISGDLNANNSDLVAEARFKDVNLDVAGNQVPLNGMQMPLTIRGPIDAPQIKVETDFLQKALKQAGKERLLQEASKGLGVDVDGDTSSQGLEKAAGDLLGGFLKKKKSSKDE